MKKHRYNQAGQVLLVVVMLLATVITVVMATTFTVRTDIQNTKLEEESQRSLAAAEAGIESALERGLTPGTFNVADISQDLEDAGFTGTVAVTNDTPSPFISPLLKAEEQYTYYLTSYNRSTNALGGAATHN